jgi:hypothetical protein
MHKRENIMNDLNDFRNELIKKENELTLIATELEKKYQQILGQRELIKELLKNFKEKEK